MKKLFLIIIVALILFYVYQFLNSPAIGVEKDVRPYLENILGFIINHKFDEIYETYVTAKNSSPSEFSEGMKYLTVLYGTPISYYYLRSYVGGTGYFVQYNITFKKGKNHSCTFAFPIKENQHVISKKDLERLSISSDFGKKQFTLFFGTGKIIACRSPEGCFGEVENNEENHKY